MADIQRKAAAHWAGTLKEGKGDVTVESGVIKDVAITFPARFESADGSNPEELIAAAHASCFSMALSAQLGKKNATPDKITTTATLTLNIAEAGFAITKIHLDMEASVPGISEADFNEAAENAKNGCPVSALLKPGLQSLTMDAKLSN